MAWRIRNSVASRTCTTFSNACLCPLPRQVNNDSHRCVSRVFSSIHDRGETEAIYNIRIPPVHWVQACPGVQGETEAIYINYNIRIPPVQCVQAFPGVQVQTGSIQVHTAMYKNKPSTNQVWTSTYQYVPVHTLIYCAFDRWTADELKKVIAMLQHPGFDSKDIDPNLH